MCGPARYSRLSDDYFARQPTRRANTDKSGGVDLSKLAAAASPGR